MLKIIKKHQKKVMTVIAIGSMIAFVSAFGTPGGSAQNPVTAHLGDTAVHASDLADSRHQWGMLRRTGVMNVFGDNNGRPVPATLALGAEAVEMIDREPDTFYMLRKEAEKMGLTALPDSIEELMQNQVTLSSTATPAEAQDLRDAFAALLTVRAGYDRAVSAVKTTDPQRQYDAAMLGQSVTLKYVVYDANEFKAAVPPPTPDQLRSQFEKYSNFLSDRPQETTNPYGFGYMYPPRVMLEYLEIPRADLREAARTSKDGKTWEIEARKEYKRAPSMYPTTLPSTQKELPVGIRSATQPTSQPTTKPLLFDAYREQIIGELITTAETNLLESVRKKIVTTMEADWAAYRAAMPATTQPATRPVTGPMTALGVSYDSPEYLPKLALAIQAEFKVLPKVVRHAKDWMSVKDLAALPEISAATLPMEDPRMGEPPFAEYAIAYLDAFGHKATRNDVGPTLSILSPSPALSDPSRNIYFFRIFAADPAHSTHDLTPFGAQVEADYKLVTAMASARAQVDKLLPIASASGVDAAAKSVGRKTFVTGRISRRGMAPMADLPLKPESQETLSAAAFDLLKRGNDVKSGKAVAVVELPREGKVLLVSVNEVTQLLPEEVAYLGETYFGRARTQYLEQAFTRQWYNPQEVEKRTQFRSEIKKEKTPAS